MLARKECEVLGVKIWGVQRELVADLDVGEGLELVEKVCKYGVCEIKQGPKQKVAKDGRRGF